MDQNVNNGAWLVTGGAGYIGSHVVRAMRDSGMQTVVLDDMSTGIAARVLDFPVIRASVFDTEVVTRACAEHQVVGVVHLAAKKRVGESIEHPLMYYRENIDGLRSILEAVTAAGVCSIVFSSSAAVYGEIDKDFVSESDECRPSSPYGRTKLIGESLLRDMQVASGLRWVSLRYFNVAGCRDASLADYDSTGLIPAVLDRLEAGKAPEIFGGDYPTIDGTCVRDFVHVSDVAAAHAAAAAALTRYEVDALTANIGTGRGTTVLQVVETARSVCGAVDPCTVPVIKPRRTGDPAYSVASVDLARQHLQWTAMAGLRDMIASTWAARQKEN